MSTSKSTSTSSTSSTTTTASTSTSTSITTSPSPSTSSISSSSTSSGALPGPTWPSGSNPYVDGRLFNIDGKTQYFAGTNTWWLSHLLSDADVETTISELVSSDIRVTRAWGFGNVNDPAGQDGNVYFQILNQTISPTNGSLINFSPTNGIPRLDSVISLAEKYGLKLVLPLLNNWDDLGGINTYTTAFGGNSTSFYTDTASQQAYQNYISFIVNRYKSSPAIFAWELCNEPRCRQCDTSVIYNWASETSAFIKGIDSGHMVAIGDEGWFAPPEGDGSYAYSAYEGVDFIKNLAIETIDYATFHLYPDKWGYDPSWGTTWIQQHSAAALASGTKPVVLEEYGSPSPFPGSSSNRSAVLLPWQATLVNDSSVVVAYDSVWQFATELPSGTDPFDEYAIYYDTVAEETGAGESEYQVLVVEHARDMLAKGSVGED
ncbi:hypothetical protein MMC06_005970 [Schaereria dolodes]|nr:hypothetical protein [Schaereria dolodes]